MEITITLPDFLAAKLETKAQLRKRPAEEVAVELLDEVLADHVDVDIDAAIARIKALPPSPELIRQPTGSLEKYLADSLAREDNDNAQFDLEAWQKGWDAFEAEQKALDKADDISEGRR